MNKIIIIIVLIIVIYFFYKSNNEKYTGAFIQLYSKDYQDSYLTDAPFMYPHYPHYPNYPKYSRYNPFFWNAPTRFTRNSAPYLLLTPERFLLY
jgi:hypothetical protein